MSVFLALGAVDIAGRVLTLLYLMRHNDVRCLCYRTWVLLTGFLNFAFVFYWLLGWQRSRAGNTSKQENAQAACSTAEIIAKNNK